MPEHFHTIIWLIPLLPLLAGVVNAFVHSKKLAFALAVGAMGISCALSLWFLFGVISADGARDVVNFTWIAFGSSAELQLGFLMNPLTAVMVAMVTFVSLLIFVYSHGYMHDDKNYARFFCFLSLFAAGMLGLCVANSLVLFFISWEIVGLCSYLLIGFWYQKPSAAAAAKKAFIVTKLGDIGLFIGIVWLYSQTGTQLLYDGGAGVLETAQLDGMRNATNAFMGMNLAGVLALLVFCGAVGKSGQFPLHVWLPDAMEGPTPVSALIHAATMVAAGVFLVGRMYPLFEAEPISLSVVGWLGAFTALFAASVAVAQRDIKRILAYSTVSQLGLMMLGLGFAGFTAGIFHLITHAFFKALLFLGAGSVIHGMHEEQDIWKMGGLRSSMKVTFATYVVGALALAGVFPLAGFWSKDEILAGAFHVEGSAGALAYVPFAMAVLTSFLTAFYMTRQVALVFFGKSRSPAVHSHESPRVMTAPLVILAAFAALLGFVGTPWANSFSHFLVGDGLHGGGASGEHEVSILFMLAMLAVPVAGIALGWRLYGSAGAPASAEADPLARIQPLHKWLEHRWYFDELYALTIVKLVAFGARAARILDVALDGITEFVGSAASLVSRATSLTDEHAVKRGVRMLASLVRASGTGFSRLQSGRVQDYLSAIALGVTLLIGVYLIVLFGK